METLARHATTVSKNTSGFTTTIPLPPPFFNPLQQEATPTPSPTTLETTTSLPALLDFASVFKFNERVFNLENDVSKIKQVDHSSSSSIRFYKSCDREKCHRISRSCSLDKVFVTYEAAASIFEFKLTKTLIDKMEKNKLYDKSDYKKKLYDALVESYNTEKDLFDSYDESAHAEEPSHIVEDSSMQQDQEFITGENVEQPADKEVTKAHWLNKPERPLTPDPDWSKRQQVDFRPPQTWISQVTHVEESPTSFYELNDTSFDLSAFVINRLKIPNLS
ncbi:hypothetical protein Tco_1453885 [Tanacetum coccineum]